MEEIWKKYNKTWHVSNFGNIKDNNDNIIDINTKNPNKPRLGNSSIGRIIYTLFKGELKTNQHVRHIDNNPTNNHIDNLAIEERKPKQKKQRVTFSDFVDRARLAHGDKYTYIEKSYLSMANQVTIICAKHGEFKQIGYDHCNGHGCRKCYDEKNKTWTEEQDNYLKLNYYVLGAGECALNLKKSKSACLSRAVTLGIAKKVKYREKHPNVPSNVWAGLMTRISKIQRGNRVDLDFTIDFVWELFLRQNGKCALTGFDLVMSATPNENTVSIDRIDSRKGYLKTNTQLVHKDVNRMKNYYGEKYFYQICAAVAKHRGDLRNFETEWVWNEYLDTEHPLSKVVPVTNPLE